MAADLWGGEAFDAFDTLQHSAGTQGFALEQQTPWGLAQGLEDSKQN